MSARKISIVAAFGAVFAATLFLAPSEVSSIVADAFMYVAVLVIFVVWAVLVYSSKKNKNK